MENHAEMDLEKNQTEGEMNSTEDDFYSKNGENLIVERHSEIPNDKIPYEGMEFQSDKKAYEFYNAYAREAGFSVRKDTAHKDRDKNILDRIFYCGRQGKRGYDKRNVIVKKHRPETRTGCQAMMKTNTRQTGKHRIETFIAVHNHPLVSRDKTHLLNSHRNMTTIQTSQVDNIDKSGIAPKAGYELMATQVGGPEYVGFTFEDYKNYLRSKRTMEMKASDTGGVLEYLQERQSEDPNFFYAIQIDKQGLIANFFWRDAQMKVAFSYFGDVVCFDTTYKKNKDNRPLALFVGVNHHKQTTVFGAALLYDETAGTFEWLFDAFAKSMGGKTPQTILTDQDAAMKSALKEKWEHVYHRLCIWHIYKNAAIHLSHVFERFTDFSSDFKACIYDYDEEVDFVNAWKIMLEKYGLVDNDWLEKLYSIREQWALVYGRQKFCGGMLSTQRSESMNSALKKYVSHRLNILLFIQNFQRLVEDRRYKELKADFWTSQSTPHLSLQVKILKHAVSVYTHEVFNLFQQEFAKAIDSDIELCSEFGEISEYKVTPPFGGHRHHRVIYNSSTCEVSCSCRKFEFAGILCSHVLKMFNYRSVKRIPEQCIKKRWTKKATEGIPESHTTAPQDKLKDSTNEEDEKRMINQHYKELSLTLSYLGTRGALTPKTYEIAKKYVLQAIEEIDASLQNRTTKEPLAEPISLVPASNVSIIGEKIIQVDVSDSPGTDINKVVIKGLKVKEKKKMTSGKRLMSGLEQATSKKRRGKQNNQMQDLNIGGNNTNPIDLVNPEREKATGKKKEGKQNKQVPNYGHNNANHDDLVNHFSFPSMEQVFSPPQPSQETIPGVFNSRQYNLNQGQSRFDIGPFEHAQPSISHFSSIYDQPVPSFTQLLEEQLCGRKQFGA